MTKFMQKSLINFKELMKGFVFDEILTGNGKNIMGTGIFKM